MAGLTLTGIRKSFGLVEVIKGIDLDISDGEFVVFVGPSGCGKSTLLRMIAGLEEISDGKLEIGDTRVNDIPAKSRGIAMVFQSYALYPHKTVYENMSFGLKIARRPKEEIEAAVRHAAGVLHIEHLLDRRPGQLSGGQRQRVAIGRAIVRDPKVFLFDEPLSNLDAALRVHMRVELAKLHERLGATMIYVTHDQVEAMTLADRIVVMEGGEASQIGSPMELYHTPANLFVAGFIGSPKMNLFEGEILTMSDDGINVAVDGIGPISVPARAENGIAPGQRVTIGVRPEHVRPDGTGENLACRIDLVENLGNHAILQLVTPGGAQLSAEVGGNMEWKAGDNLTVSFDPGELHLFDASGLAAPRLALPQVLQT